MTLVDIRRTATGVRCDLEGELIVPRLVRRTDTTATVALVAGRALLLPGDTVELQIRVDDGCQLELIDVGGLVVYGDGPGDPSTWVADITLGDDAVLRWDALPTVVTDNATLHRSTRVRLGAGAAATLRETLVWGRASEVGGTVDADTAVTDPAGPILRERLIASGAAPVPGVMGAARVMDTVLAVGDHRELAECDGADILTLDRAGVLYRWLGVEAHHSPLRDAIASGVPVPREVSVG